MTFFHEIGAAILLIIFTLWLQCSGLAVLILWVRHVVAGDLHRLGPFRSAILIVQPTAAVIVLHGILILLSLALLPFVGICFLLLGLQLYHRGLRRRGSAAKLAGVGAAREHYRRVNVRNIRKRSVCDCDSARQPRCAILALDFPTCVVNQAFEPEHRLTQPNACDFRATSIIMLAQRIFLSI